MELPDLPEEEKQRIIKEAINTASYVLLFSMGLCKIENYIIGTVENNGTTYELTFKRIPKPPKD